MEPLSPRITKSTSVAAIKARFPDNEALLARFEVAKSQANLWDGERDGLREAVKTLEGGQYGRHVLSWGTSSPVMYPNAEGKHQLESTLQTTCPAPTTLEEGDNILCFQVDGSPEAFLDAILHNLQKGKEQALAFVQERFIGSGTYVANATLYSSKGADKSTITVLP